MVGVLSGFTVGIAEPTSRPLPSDPGPARRLLDAIAGRQLDALTITSSPALSNLLHLAGHRDDWDDLSAALTSEDILVACVGPVCAGRAREGEEVEGSRPVAWADMALAPNQELEFDEDDLAPVARVIAELAVGGQGWVNLRPEVEPGQAPPPRGVLFALLSGRGESVPLVTWSAEGVGARRGVGITHGSGPRAIARLRQRDLDLPPGWTRQADHPKRGLVLTTPPDADADAAVWWLLTAAHILSDLPLTGAWQAKVYEG